MPIVRKGPRITKALIQTIVAFDVSDPTWRESARCDNSAAPIFFPERGTTAQVAREICSTCPVQVECLAYAVRTKQAEGVWGGSVGVERNLIRKVIVAQYGSLNTGPDGRAPRQRASRSG